MDFPAVLPVLETPRLRLSPYAPADAAEVQRLAGDKAIADTTLMIPPPDPDGGAEAWIGTQPTKWVTHEEMVLAITLRSSSELLGSLGLVILTAHEQAELG